MNPSPSRFKKIVFTGGRGGGKSSSLVYVTERLVGHGWRVYICPEMATPLILGGAKPTEMSAQQLYDFQCSMVRCQVAFEAAFERQAAHSDRPTVIICDRGIYDAFAFIDPVSWQGIMGENGLTVSTARDGRYDAVFHIMTAAKGAEAFYSCANNPARYGNAEDARAEDDRLIRAWTGHPHFRIINNNCANFEEKKANVLKGVCEVLGIPDPIENERKFVVELVGPLPEAAQTFEIVQHYLHNEGAVDEVRVRRRGQNNDWVFTKTIKRPRPGAGPVEYDHFITPREYFREVNEHPHARQVHKRRTCFVHDDRYFELDDFGVMKVLELETDWTGPIEIPPFLRMVREVTHDPSFRNVNMSSASGVVQNS